jgi:DinB superfamily
VVHNLEHLFLVGEFPERAHLLSGLTLEQVTLCPDGASHSIYEELWHAAGYQRSVVEREQVTGEFYPSAVPQRAQQWDDLVRQFLDGARAAVAWAESPERLALEVEPGVTMADELHSVAVHNAYHLGKIVALRQRIGAWPPPGASAES